MGMQGIDRTGVGAVLRSTPSRLMVSDSSGVNSHRTISVSPITAVVQDHQAGREALDDLSLSSKKIFGTTSTPSRRTADQVLLPQVLMHLGDRDAEDGRHGGQVVDGFVGVENVLGGRNGAHRTESKMHAWIPASVRTRSSASCLDGGTASTP